MKRTKKIPQKLKFQSPLLKHKYLLAAFVLIFVSIGVKVLFFTDAYVPSMRFNDGEFTSLVPARIYNEIVNQGDAGIASVQINGKGGIPLTGVRAVTANITIAGPSAASYLTVYPSGAARPDASSINFTAATSAIANEITVNVGSDGKINIYNAYGYVRVIIDISGYFSDESGNDGSRFVSLNPARIFDEQIPLPPSTNPMRQVQISGRGGVPTTGVTSVIANVTVAAPTQPSYLTIFPSDAVQPTASSLNFTQNTGAIANQITVKLGADGKINIYNAYGAARVIVDISGYYTTDGDRFVGMSPSRVHDSSFTENKTKTIKIAGVAGVPASHVKAVLVNVTAAGPTKPGYLVAYPSKTTLPTTSSINFTPATGAIANQLVIKLGTDGSINIQNRYGDTRVVLDISGYYLNNDQLETIPYDAALRMSANPNTSLQLINNDISYGPSPSQTYDIYETANQPAKATVNQDTIIWFYGGGWENGDNGLTTGYDTIAKHLAAEYGYKLVAANYRKSGEAPYPAQYQDAIAIVKDLKWKAASLGIDPNRLIIGGFSAGGDIASMAAYGNNAPEFQPTFLNPAAAAQSAQVYRIMTFATPFTKTKWAQNYFSNASPIAGLNKLIAGSASAPSYNEYAKLDILSYVDASDAPHYTVMSQNDTVIPLNSQLAEIQAIGRKATTVFQYGGPNGHASGLDTNVTALLEFLK